MPPNIKVWRNHQKTIAVEKMSQTKPHASVPLPHPPKWRVFLAGFPHGDPKAAKIMHHCKSPFWIATFRGEGGVICGLIVFRQIQTEDGQ